MLARHAFALLVIPLLARPAGAGELQPAQIAHTSPASASDCLVASDVPGCHEMHGCGDTCVDPFCPLSLVDQHHCWYVQVDALVLHRTTGRNRPLAIASDSGDRRLETNDLDLNFEPGPRLLLGRRTGCDRGWELSYFGLHEWSASAAAEDPNNLDIPGTLLGVAEDYTGADRVAIDYAARLHNAEANLVRDRDAWSALAGLRYLHLNEQVVLTASDSDSGTSDYTAESHSDLIGAQLGFRGGRLRGLWGWELTMKAGLYGSLVQQEQLLLDNDNTFVLRQNSNQTSSAAFLGDIHLVGFRRLSDVWSLRGGYYAMYVAGVAPATDQLDFDNLADSGRQVGQGDLFLHGASLGLEARW